jgi:hypothetical protein
MRKPIFSIVVLLPLVLSGEAFATGGGGFGGGGGGGGDSGPRSGDNANACVSLRGSPTAISSTTFSQQVFNSCNYAIVVTSQNSCSTNNTTISGGSTAFITNANCTPASTITYTGRVF